MKSVYSEYKPLFLDSGMSSYATHERRHRCFCGLCRATTGALLIGGFEITLAFYFLASAIIIRERYGDNDRYGSVLANIYFVFSGCLLVVVTFLLLGVFTRRRTLLLVHLLKDVIFILAISIISILTLLAAITYGIGSLLINADPNANPQNRLVSDALTTATGYMVFSLLLVVTYAALQIWFFAVVLSAYKCISRGSQDGESSPTRTWAANLPWSRVNFLKYGYTPSPNSGRREPSIGLSIVHLENCAYAKRLRSPTAL